MRLSYLLKLTVVSATLGLLPLCNVFACPCDKAKTNVTTKSNTTDNSDVEYNSNAETQQEPAQD